MHKNKIVTIIISCLLICSATAVVISFGIVGYGRHYLSQHPVRNDSKTIYLAGKTWLEGFNAYDASIASKILDKNGSPQEYGFSYPPSSAIFVMIFALLDLDDAQLIYIIINILCLIIFVYIIFLILSAPIGNQFFITDIRKSLLIAMAIGSVPVVNTFWMGQTSIIISTFLVLAYYFYVQSNNIKSGIFLSLALMKPQLSYTFFLWLILEKKWKILSVSMISTFILLMAPFGLLRINHTFSAWINGLGNYFNKSENQIGNWTLSSVRLLLSDLGIKTCNSIIVIIISIILIIIIHKYNKNINIINLLAVLTIIALLFGQAHHYDLVITATILPYFLAKISATDYRSLILLSASFLVFNLPRKALLLKMDYRVINSHREIMLFLVLLIMLFNNDRDKRLV